MAKKKVKRFDVWVTRHHFANNSIIVSHTATTDIERTSGCTIFHRTPRYAGRNITKETCLKRYGFLPQPATCWNVWNDARGVIRHQEYPILEKDSGRTYKARPFASEKKHYL